MEFHGNLGSLEKQVMDIVWEDQKCSVRDIKVKLEIKRKRKIAYTTVATILQRLHDKSLLTRSEQRTFYLYSPKLSKESYAKSLAGFFIQKFIGSFGDAGLASFAQTIEKLPKQERQYFLKLLRGK